ncbi:MAG: hypothetical protein CMH38_09485 [Microbacterium sp.]|nr:hypothetical protein [Microbacterium sp.]HAS31226.1 hypothetical protein [Microbacterium sp.]HBR87875.1 hypothetical protein [Microbacterium sp.]
MSDAAASSRSCSIAKRMSVPFCRAGAAPAPSTAYNGELDLRRDGEGTDPGGPGGHARNERGS